MKAEIPKWEHKQVVQQTKFWRCINNENKCHWINMRNHFRPRRKKKNTFQEKELQEIEVNIFNELFLFIKLHLTILYLLLLFYLSTQLLI